MRKKHLITMVLILLLFVAAGVAIAAFGDKGEILGSSFSIGSADIKFLKALDGGTANDNLTDQLNGPSFTNISSNWNADYALKIYNNANTAVQLTTNADYVTANDPDDLRQIIFVEPIQWDDLNNDGVATSDELGQSYGEKTIVKWKTEGYSLDSLDTGLSKGLVLRFSTDSVPDSKQGKSALFDFIFDSISLE